MSHNVFECVNVLAEVGYISVSQGDVRDTLQDISSYASLLNVLLLHSHTVQDPICCVIPQ
jgi:hypothetical protein